MPPARSTARRHDRAREVILNGFTQIIDNPRITEIDQKMIARWRLHLEQTGDSRNGPRSAQSARQAHLITVKAFLNRQRKYGYIKVKPTGKLNHKTQVKITMRQVFLTTDERERLLADENVPESVRFIQHIGFFAGLCDGERLAMTSDWMGISGDDTHGTITVHNTDIICEDAHAFRPDTACLPGAGGPAWGCGRTRASGVWRFLEVDDVRVLAGAVFGVLLLAVLLLQVGRGLGRIGADFFVSR